jgi:3-hydroxyisobutyrate dehydrogenase-like beta-hydroxyacid dehydrogenase
LLAERAGVDIANMATINQLSEVDASGPTMCLKSWTSRDSIPGGATANHEHVQAVMLKDIDAAAALAEKHGLHMRLIDLIRENADDITAPWK